MKGSGNGNYKMMIVNDQGSVITRTEGDIFQGNDHPKDIMKSVLENNEKRSASLQRLITRLI